MSVIICKAILFYLEDGSPDGEYDSLQNHDLHLKHDASPDNNFQSSKLMTIILQWQKQQKLIISLKNLLGKMNHL
jgi:hypothetical protein